MGNILFPSDWQACLQPMTWSCQKWFTKLLWKSMRRELRLLLPLVLSWISAVQDSLRDSMQTILSSSSSHTTTKPPGTFCLLVDIALLSDHWTFRMVVNHLCSFYLQTPFLLSCFSKYVFIFVPSGPFDWCTAGILHSYWETNSFNLHLVSLRQSKSVLLLTR